jgi:hypothetical protein
MLFDLRMEENIKQMVDKIKEHIETRTNILKYFNKTYSSQKYDLEELLPTILTVLKCGISWRDTSKLKTSGEISWNTFYKMHQKLIKYKIYEGTYEDVLKKYYIEGTNVDSLKVRSTDTTVIINKQGIDKVSYNKAYPKHKITKLSIITDNSKVVLNAKLFDGSVHDSKILHEQLTTDGFVDRAIDDKNKDTMLGDAAYDSTVVMKQLHEVGYKRLICPKNRRNTKNVEKLKNLKLSPEDKSVIKNRIKVEHVFNDLKMYKRLQIRYDKISQSFMGFVYLAILDNFLKRHKTS